jgi:hypothetical protein
MRQRPPQMTFPDEETLQAWENMRVEVLHELQDGASADIPDSYLDELGTLVAVLDSNRAKKKLRVRVVNRPQSK